MLDLLKGLRNRDRESLKLIFMLREQNLNPLFKLGGLNHYIDRILSLTVILALVPDHLQLVHDIKSK